MAVLRDPHVQRARTVVHCTGVGISIDAPSIPTGISFRSGVDDDAGCRVPFNPRWLRRRIRDRLKQERIARLARKRARVQISNQVGDD